MVDLALVEAFITLVFAVLYVVAQEYALKFAAKYLFLIGVLVTTFQLWIEYTGHPELLSLFIFSVVILFIFLILDAIQFLPITIAWLRQMMRR